MLKKFFLNCLSSFVGTWVALVLFGIAAVLMIVGVAARLGDSENITGSVKKHSVLVIDLDGQISESLEPSGPDYVKLVQGDIEKPKALNQIVEGIKVARENENIEAIYLKCGALQASPATINSIRDAIAGFKKSGKKVYAYGDGYTLGTYYIASIADKVMLNPYGSVVIQGIGGTTLFMKGLFNKLGIEFQVVKVGTFKSAVEPYISTHMSDPARAQLDTLFGATWDYINKGICNNRKALSPEKINHLVSSGVSFATAEDVKKYGLVDELIYERSVDDRIAKLISVDKDELNYVTTETLIGQIPWIDSYGTKNNIAILYATGEIIDEGKGGINYHDLVPVITELAEDDNIKGMVLRVNSPGGSAFGSDQIGEALDYFKSKKKVLAVSMGDYAASGGYWISCGADRIFANPLTVTGSIGIFGLIPNAKGLADKLGVNPVTVTTNPDAAFPSFTAPMTESQLAIMQKYVENGYDRFISRVSKGRKMPESKVRAIAEGRVWNAMKAKEIGLVDELGQLQDAVGWVAKKCNIYSNYNISVYPVFKPGFWDLLPTIDVDASVEITGDKEVDDAAKEIAKKILTRQQILAIMPEFQFKFN
ncbi:MAG: signal peptide peptidase SppA [Roseburia sp.]|nr:signal peptide peptidase SppA [Roseburia sp.]